MIEAAITKACRIGGNRHQHCVATKFVLHRTNCTPQPDPEWFSQRGDAVKLQRAHDLAETSLVRTDPSASGAAGWCDTAFNAASTSETKLTATLGAEERPLHTTGAATLRGQER
jgi:hypothetical protein